MSMVDPKGARPRIYGKSKVYEIIERDRRLRHELQMKMWPALPAALVQLQLPVLEPAGEAATSPIDPL
jgi:hypothetical protein